jgi:hypothetical protein
MTITPTTLCIAFFFGAFQDENRPPMPVQSLHQESSSWLYDTSLVNNISVVLIVVSMAHSVKLISIVRSSSSSILHIQVKIFVS